MLPIKNSSKRTFQFLFLLVFLIQPSYAQIVESWVDNKGGFLDSIPIAYTNGRIYVKLKIGQDTTQYRFLLDTGAPCVISKKLQEKFAYKILKKQLTTSSVEGVKDSTSLVVIPSVKIGKIDFVNTLASIIDVGYLNSSGLQIDGILGANLMRLCVWQIDVSKKQIYLTHKNSKLKNIEPKSFLKFEHYGKYGSPLVQVSYNNKIEEAALFDTGSTQMYTMCTRAFDIGTRETFKPSDIRTKPGRVGTVFGDSGIDSITCVSVAKLSLNEKIIFNAIEVEVLSDVSLIGTAFLEKYITTLDFRRQRIYYSPLNRSGVIR